VTKVGLRQEAWVCDEPVWWRPLGGTALTFVPLTAADRTLLSSALAENGRPPVGATRA
jgi:hypothetical protein